MSGQLGARWDGAATTFAVFSSAAERIDLCLFDGPAGSGSASASLEKERLPLTREGNHWYASVPGVGPGQRYGLRVTGPDADPAKLVLDPYAQAIEGDISWEGDLFAPGVDSAPHTPRCLVANPYFDWGETPRPRVPWSDTLIYETHVKGLTATHPEVPPAERGTFRGLAHPAVVEHLTGLGVTTVELLPVQHFASEHRLRELGLTNYWGYNTVGFFAPHAPYAASRAEGGQVGEFKGLVRSLHAAGLEVVLDVVYNHTAEGGNGGPVLSLRGLDERAYYRLGGDPPEEHVNWTGTGNTLNVDHPAALRLVLDSLRYWVTEMGVDGFRFDLAPVLGRDHGRFDPGAAFFDALYQDPVLSQVKLIAEPWDVGPDGYQLGHFPLGWAEWNGHYRDTVRDFWRGTPGTLGRFAACLSGSEDVFRDPARGPGASVNLVTCHDGFTLLDLVSYEQRHNEANGEDNRDGHHDNRSWNGGIEGPTDDPAIQSLRARQQRNFLATLAVSQGVPMLAGGDEIGRTQRGNNNAYCQDNELSWYDWDAVDLGLVHFTGRLAALRAGHGVLRRRRWATGEPSARTGAVDVAWYGPDGAPMTERDWLDHHRRALTMVLDGRGDNPPQERVGEASLIVLANAGSHRQLFRIPPEAWPGSWAKAIDSAEGPRPRPRRYASGERVRLEPFSLVVLTGQP